MDKPSIHLASDKSDADYARERAEEEVLWALRELTANLMRVTRGAGKPWQIVHEAARFIEAVAAYRDVCPSGFPDFTSLQVDTKPLSRLKGADLYRAMGEEQVVRGALQITASRILDQATQRAAGHHEMYDGLRAIEEARREAREERERVERERQAAMRAEKAAKRKKAKPAASL